MEKASTFSCVGSMDAFEDILSLIVYGLFLFWIIEGFANGNAIWIFVNENPMPALLGDAFHSIHNMTSKGYGSITFYAPLL